MTQKKKITNRKKDHKKTVYLSPALIADVEAEAAQHHQRFSEFCRLALEDRLKNQRGGTLPG